MDEKLILRRTGIRCPVCNMKPASCEPYEKNIIDLPFYSDGRILYPSKITINRYFCPNCNKHYIDYPDGYILQNEYTRF